MPSKLADSNTQQQALIDAMYLIDSFKGNKRAAGLYAGLGAGTINNVIADATCVGTSVARKLRAAADKMFTEKQVAPPSVQSGEGTMTHLTRAAKSIDQAIKELCLASETAQSFAAVGMKAGADELTRFKNKYLNGLV